MWELDCEESWAPKYWCFWTVVLEKILESPLGCKEVQALHSEDQPWDFFGRNDAKAEIPILWPPHAKSWLIGKDSDGRVWGQEEKGTTEDEMAGWHHRLDGHEFGWTPGDGDGQGGLECCNSRGCKESDTTERLNWTGEYNITMWLRQCISARLETRFIGTRIDLDSSWSLIQTPLAESAWMRTLCYNSVLWVQYEWAPNWSTQDSPFMFRMLLS